MPEDEIVMEPEDGEGNTANAGQKLKDLREKLKEVQRQRDEYLDSLQRMKADYINAKKRFEEDTRALSEFASQALVIELLPVADSLEYALAHSKDSEGLINTHKELQKIFSAHGVESFDPIGEIFNPANMEPVETLAVKDESEDNRVTKTHQKGYTLHGRVIRPARIAVGHYQK